MATDLPEGPEGTDLTDLPEGTDLPKGRRVRDDRERVDTAYRLLYGRPASEEEVRAGLKFIRRENDAKDAWISYCLVLLASSEMVYID